MKTIHKRTKRKENIDSGEKRCERVFINKALEEVEKDRLQGRMKDFFSTIELYK